MLIVTFLTTSLLLFHQLKLGFVALAIALLADATAVAHITSARCYRINGSRWLH